MTESKDSPPNLWDRPVAFRYGGLVAARNVALGVLPAAYVFGFLGWGAHLYEYNLGWVPAPPERLLAIGFVALAFGAVMVLALVLARLMVASRGDDRSRLGLALLAYPVAGAVSVGGLMLALGGFGMLQEETLPLGVVLLVGAFVSSVAAAAVFALQRSPFRRPPADPHELDLTSTVVVTMLLTGLILPYMFMGELAPEFGGTRPAFAAFEIDPDMLTPGMRKTLIESVNETTGYGYTDALYVLVTTSDGFLVRNTTSDPRTGPLYEIPRSSVALVRWIG